MAEVALYSAVGGDGTLAFVCKADVGPAEKVQDWAGMVGYGA